jgi:DNA-directed RNA polymerase subunit beta'
MNTAFDSISIKIASPDQIKDESKKTSCKRRNPAQAVDDSFICPEKGTCSCGEVKKAETINYRSFRPEPEGLFCEAIFGPQKDWECNCGKYKRIKHKGMICDRCGVEITQQRVRRDRLGYIQLAAPVSHIWYFKGIPSRIGTFCELSSRDVERVLYFEGFIVVEVTDPDCPLERGQVLTEIEYIEHSNKYWGGFRAGTGAEVIRELLSDIDLEAEIEKLTTELEETTSQQKKLKIAKQLKQMADFAEVGQRPEWMILDVIPVIPPDLRPLVPLEGGRFATSDLNDLYRRVINRNNRLRKLIQLRSPEVILRNEKRMLQEAVDAFFDNGRHGRRVTGPGNRPLKSLADVLKGKIGRFRQNLLGKRVDYSGRSVIVVGPELGLHQCGIPKRMAVELFKPFIIERLQAYGHTQTIKRAKHLAEHVDSDSPVWEVVEEVIADHPVLLNRPPTLHRLGIQAFLPVLVEGKSIRIPPLVCKAFNADFDGDQMAVHVPLTVEAQAEAKLLMLSSHNILKPSHGGPIAVPELDMVLGPSFLTKVLPGHAEDAALLHAAYTTKDESAFDALRDKSWYHRRYAQSEEVVTAHVTGQLKLHDNLQFFCAHNGNDGKPTEPILTTVGRIIFNEVLPSELEWEDEHSNRRIPFFNAEAGGRELSQIVDRCFNELGTRVTTEVLENIQKLAFEYATLSGVSPGITDYLTPDNRDALVNDAQVQIDTLLDGASATESEEHENEQIRIWLGAKDKIEDKMFNTLPQIQTALVERGDPRKVHPYVDPTGSEILDKTVEGFSPVHIMADSGARARKDPFMQISAFIGLKAKQSGEILIPPITSSYREGLDVIDYFNSTYGSRKGLVDTAMKTAASGYLTRKLVDVAQDVRVTLEDCGTLNSIQKFPTVGGDLAFKISGRVAGEDVPHPETGAVLVPADAVISVQMADQIDKLGIKMVKVRSVLTCQADEGVCTKCYGNDLTTNNLVNVGEAVGIIAAQSIGEPGTQLTMRTFHTGGAVEDVSEARQRRILSKVTGTARFLDFQPGRTVKEEGELWIAIENRMNFDGPAYKVLRINHPECQLRVEELLSEKQYIENTERYKGFDTKAWQYEVTAVLDSGCDLMVGDRLSQAEYAKAQEKYGFQRFAQLHYRVTNVHHPDVSLKSGDRLTADDVETLKAKIRQGFDGEWHYLDSETDARLAAESLTAAGTVDASLGSEERDANFKRVYRVTEKTNKAFPFKVGDEVTTEAITPWLTPFDVDSKPVYVMNTEIADAPALLKQTTLLDEDTTSDASPLTVGQILTEREYTEARTQYKQLERAFKVERQETERHYVTHVYHPECPLKEGEELTKDVLVRAHRRFTGFDAQKLRHRVTRVHHPDCTLKSGALLTESEAKQLGENYLGFTTSQSKTETGSFNAERLYRVTVVNHPDCPLEADELLTQRESTAKRRQYKGLEVARHYEVTNVEDGSTALTVGQRLTEIEYKALRKKDATLTRKVQSLYHVVSVHHPELELEVGVELTDQEYRTYNRKFKGFDTELVYQIIADERDTDTLLDQGTILLSKEYRALEKANQRVTHTVTEVYHPHCQYTVGEELAEEVYESARAQYPGFEVDELTLRMRIEVETADGNRVPHVIPQGYSFDIKDGDSLRAGETLAELHERTANSDIVAGIPRVTELFEARRPKSDDAAEIAEIEGYVRSAGTKNGVPNYRIEHEGYESRLYPIPDEKRRVAEGDWVNAGDSLTDGFLNPHDILRIGRTTIEGVSVEGEEAVWAYLVDEVQSVYGEGTINDKHVETIVRQMLTKIRITEPGDTNFYPNDEIQRKEFQRVNNEVEVGGGTPASGEPILQSISKASLSTDSFISAASFQQTTKVLTDAAVSGQTDRLYGLKENVILGRLIPVGSGFSGFRNLDVDTADSELAEASDDD